MIKAPKELWKRVQDCKSFIDATQQITKVGLNMEITHIPNCLSRWAYVGTKYARFDIKLYNLQWSSVENITSPILPEKSYYERMLVSQRADLEKLIAQAPTKGFFKKEPVDTFEISQLKNEIKFFEDILNHNKPSSPGQYNYDQLQEKINSFPERCATLINKMIKEYEDIKFCVDDIILY